MVMEIFALSFGGAIASTLPIGPINIALMLLVWQKRSLAWSYCVGGIVLADGLMAGLAFAISGEIYQHWIVGSQQYCWKMGAHALSILLLLLSAALLWRLRRSHPSSQAGAEASASHMRSALGWLSWGFFMTAVEPGLLPFWSAWWLMLSDHQTLSWTTGGALALGLLGGDLLVFSAFRWLTSRLSLSADGRLFVWMSRMSAAILGGMALYLTLRLFLSIYYQNEDISACLSIMQA